MSVDNHKTVFKINIDEFISRAKNASHVISAPIEHYSQKELIDIAERAKKENLVMTILAEHSNFYQGVMINLVKREYIKGNLSKNI